MCKWGWLQFAADALFSLIRMQLYECASNLIHGAYSGEAEIDQLTLGFASAPELKCGFSCMPIDRFRDPVSFRETTALCGGCAFFFVSLFLFFSSLLHQHGIHLLDTTEHYA